MAIESPSETGPDELAVRIRRQGLAWGLARSNAPRIMGLIDERQRAIIRRFLPDEQPLISSDWPICRQVVAACLPDVIEVFLDVLADGISPKLLDQIGRRCIPTPTATAYSSSSPGSSA